MANRLGTHSLTELVDVSFTGLPLDGVASIVIVYANPVFVTEDDDVGNSNRSHNASNRMTAVLTVPEDSAQALLTLNSAAEAARIDPLTAPVGAFTATDASTGSSVFAPLAYIENNPDEGFTKVLSGTQSQTFTLQLIDGVMNRRGRGNTQPNT